MKALRYLIPAILFAGLVGVFAVQLGEDPSVIPSPLIGKPAPTFALPSVENPEEMVNTADLKGRMYVLNAWGTWCPPCYQEHPTLVEIAKTSAVPLIGLNWKDELPKAQQWLQELGNPYEMTGFDADGKAGIDWGVYAAPETFLVDPQGVIIHKHIGPITMEVWQREFLPRIQEAQRTS